MTYADLAASPALVSLRAEALARIPARHLEGDVAYVEVTEVLCQQPEARNFTASALAKVVTESLDEAAAEWKAEQEKMAVPPSPEPRRFQVLLLVRVAVEIEAKDQPDAERLAELISARATLSLKDGAKPTLNLSGVVDEVEVADVEEA